MRYLIWLDEVAKNLKTAENADAKAGLVQFIVFVNQFNAKWTSLQLGEAGQGP